MTTADRTELGDSRASDLVGRTIASYRVDGFVGAGGMGEVYRAHDTKLGRDVAIKILPRALVADADRLARFEREARILAALNHPNIATIHGIEGADGVRALVLELIAGETLDDRLRRRPLPLADALAIARQIADALDAAHEKGIVHRDVKPANVMITETGLVKVLDFGIAAMRLGPSPEPVPEAPADATIAGAIRGTAPYMSRAGLPSTSAPTSGRSAACSTRCSRAARRSNATRRPTRWLRSSSASQIGARCRARRPPA
jgi:serine/threonine protein kinase